MKPRAVIEGVVTDAENEERRARNIMRAQAAIVSLGPRWVGYLPPKSKEPACAPFTITITPTPPKLTRVPAGKRG